jgi:hypothetical protein
MRWKLLRRRLSISAPRMIVRSHLPWPMRWAVLALAFGFSAALALWAFEFGKDIAGLDYGTKEELRALRVEVAQLRAEREKGLSTANTVESLLRAEKAAQDKLAEQLRRAETENLALKNDLGFFERLLPADDRAGLSIRGLQVEPVAAGQMRYQLLLTQPGRTPAEFTGRYEVVLNGTLEGRPWSRTLDPKPFQLKHSRRIDGLTDHPPAAVIKNVTVRVADRAGTVVATQSVKPVAP